MLKIRIILIDLRVTRAPAGCLHQSRFEWNSQTLFEVKLYYSFTILRH